MIKVAAIIFIAFFQTSESSQVYFEIFKQTINEAKICTVGKKLNHTITILFWNKLVDGMIDGLGFEPFQTCLHNKDNTEKRWFHNTELISSYYKYLRSRYLSFLFGTFKLFLNAIPNYNMCRTN